MHNQSLVSLTLARERATVLSQPVFVGWIGSEAGVSSVMMVFASGSATIHAVQASRYVPRCKGVTGAGRSDHCSVRFGMIVCRAVERLPPYKLMKKLGFALCRVRDYGTMEK